MFYQYGVEEVVIGRRYVQKVYPYRNGHM